MNTIINLENFRSYILGANLYNYEIINQHIVKLFTSNGIFCFNFDLYNYSISYEGYKYPFVGLKEISNFELTNIRDGEFFIIDIYEKSGKYTTRKIQITIIKCPKEGIYTNLGYYIYKLEK